MVKVDRSNSYIAEAMEKMKRAYGAVYDDYLSAEEEEEFERHVQQGKNNFNITINRNDR